MQIVYNTHKTTKTLLETTQKQNLGLCGFVWFLKKPEKNIWIKPEKARKTLIFRAFLKNRKIFGKPLLFGKKSDRMLTKQK